MSRSMLSKSKYFKIRVTVPVDEVDSVRKVLGESGAGRVGKYSHCSFSYPVTGYFKPEEGASPAVGKVGKLETVEEYVVEAICHQDILEEVVEKLKKAHPYEEPAIDILSRYEVG